MYIYICIYIYICACVCACGYIYILYMLCICIYIYRLSLLTGMFCIFFLCRCSLSSICWRFNGWVFQKMLQHKLHWLACTCLLQKTVLVPNSKIRYPRITWRWREKEREREIESRRCRSENHVPPLHISPFRNSGLQRFGANCRCRITDPNWLGFSWIFYQTR